MMSRMIRPVFKLLSLSLCIAADAQSRQQIPANYLIPRPAPSAPLADWISTKVHATLTETVGDATLRGWEYRTSKPVATILFFNGNGMTIDRSDPLYRELATLGADVCVYDYRGIGFSTGTPDILTFRQDALHLFDAVAAAHPDRPLIVYGFSIGTAIAGYVASQRKLDGLILAGTIGTAAEELPVYLGAQGIAAATIARVAPAPDNIEAFDTVGHIAHSTAPLLMLHGEADVLVPIAQGREVFAASPSAQKKFIPLPGISHNQTANSPESLRAIAGFIARRKGKSE
jgi:alpha-beta hydrolase superfamily lysophospholipase